MSKATTASRSKNITVYAKVGTPLTFLQEHYIHCEARLLVNGGNLLPLGQSISPPPELIERIRQQCTLTRKGR